MALAALPLVAQGVAAAGKQIGRAADPYRQDRRQIKQEARRKALLSRRSPQSLGLSEQRIKQDVGKAAENIEAKIGAGTREAMRGLQAQPDYQRGIQTKILGAAADARGQALADVEGGLRSTDAQLEAQQAREIEQDYKDIAFKAGPEARFLNQKIAVAQQQADKTRKGESKGGLSADLGTMEAAIKALGGAYAPPK